MTIAVDIRHRLGTFDLDASFQSDGRLTALYGASGSGKTSLVNIIAGLERPAAGRVVVDGRVLVDTHAGIFVPMHRREIGYVFQEGRLFPHLNVERNLRYGRFFTPRTRRYVDFGDVVELLGIGHLLARMPRNLSGGEKQRVAIGRALLASPRLMIMDEPLAALDDARKAEILPFIERLRDEAGIPIVYVSHAIAEVSRLATDVIVLAEGRVAASGPASTILGNREFLPDADRNEAGSVIDMVVEAHDEPFALTVLRSAAGKWRLPRVAALPGTRLRVRVRARDVMIATQPPKGISALNVFAGTITAIDPSTGADAIVTVECGADRILARATRRSVSDLALKPGKAIHLLVKSVTFDSANAAPAVPAASAADEIRGLSGRRR